MTTTPTPSAGFTWADFVKDLEFALGILKAAAPVLDVVYPPAAPIVSTVETVGVAVEKL